eukprot:CAMPEP_0202850610 /NCGR_PEP_ID=MMETSP1389-20130828/84105_1 /ASSEMBLY_ACC=CAM_ASM_000865 /TAXON_ID=302021 /ORGANISM="Rhodomonas sp., Strain CCMP768" /LENGTH=183 /DNA_ID=CAMNT_0049528817 /DNA_START=193 /DNA_END=742 /DNA_ORIENTATION=-
MPFGSGWACLVPAPLDHQSRLSAPTRLAAQILEQILRLLDGLLLHSALPGPVQTCALPHVHHLPFLHSICITACAVHCKICLFASTQLFGSTNSVAAPPPSKKWNTSPAAHSQYDLRRIPFSFAMIQLSIGCAAGVHPAARSLRAACSAAVKGVKKLPNLACFCGTSGAGTLWLHGCFHAEVL